MFPLYTNLKCMSICLLYTCNTIWCPGKYCTFHSIIKWFKEVKIDNWPELGIHHFPPLTAVLEELIGMMVYSVIDILGNDCRNVKTVVIPAWLSCWSIWTVILQHIHQSSRQFISLGLENVKQCLANGNFRTTNMVDLSTDGKKTPRHHCNWIWFPVCHWYKSDDALQPWFCWSFTSVVTTITW